MSTDLSMVLSCYREGTNMDPRMSRVYRWAPTVHSCLFLVLGSIFSRAELDLVGMRSACRGGESLSCQLVVVSNRFWTAVQGRREGVFLFPRYSLMRSLFEDTPSRPAQTFPFPRLQVFAWERAPNLCTHGDPGHRLLTTDTQVMKDVKEEDKCVCKKD